MQRTSTAAVALVLLATATTVAGICCPVLDVRKSSNLDAKFNGNDISYFCDGLKNRNIWTFVRSPTRVPAKGAATSFTIDVRDVSNTAEAKFTVHEDFILRWTNNGKVATWVVWDGSFKVVGPSKILPGSGVHTVSIVVNVGSGLIVEDGALVGEGWRDPEAEITPGYDIQLWDTGATIDMTVSDIYYTSGSGCPTTSKTIT